MGNLLRKRRILTGGGSSSSGGGTDPADKTRITNLENNEYKVIYWEAINTDSGAISKPTNSTILLDSFQQGIDALVETIIGGQPSGLSPITSGGSYVAVSSFDTTGNFTLSGVPDSFPVAIVYILKIKAVNYANLNVNSILAAEVLNVSGINTGDETATRIATINHNTAVKSTLIDADEITGQDSANSFSLIRTTWTSVKAFLKTYFDTLYEKLTNKDSTGGYVGLTLFKINFKNAANTFTSFFTNSNTTVRTYSYQDRDGIIADDTDLALKLNVSSKATTSDINTGTDDAKYATSLGLEGSKYLAMKMTKINATVAIGTTTAYTATLTPAITTYSGISVLLTIPLAQANTTTTPTLNLNSISADVIQQRDGSVIPIGTLFGKFWVTHNGTNWVLLTSPVGTTVSTVVAGNDSRIKGFPIINYTTAVNLADATTYYMGCLGTVGITLAGIGVAARKVYAQKIGTITSAQITIINASIDGTTENSTFSCRVNDTTDYLLSNAIQFSGTANGKIYFITGLSIPLTNINDFVVTKILTPTWVTNPTSSHIEVIYYIE